MNMDSKIIIVLIITRSIPLADGLTALLKAMSEISEVRIVRSVDTAIEQIQTAKPRLILIDLALPGSKPEKLLERIVSLSPRTQRILLADNVQAMNWIPRYAEAILIKGAAPSAVAKIVNNLLSEKGENHEHNDSN